MLSRSLFKKIPKVASVTSVIITMHLVLDDITFAFNLVSVQVTVRNNFHEATLELY